MTFNQNDVILAKRPYNPEDNDQSTNQIHNDNPNFISKSLEIESNGANDKERMKNLNEKEAIKVYFLSPIYSIMHSRNSGHSRRRIAAFINYLMLVSLFLACLYSLPDFDVISLIFIM